MPTVRVLEVVKPLRRFGSGSNPNFEPFQRVGSVPNTSQHKVGGHQVQQALQLQSQGQDRDQETRSDDKREMAGSQVSQTTVRAGTHCSLPKMVWPQRGQQMLVVWRRQAGGPDPGTPRLQLQSVE